MNKRTRDYKQQDRRAAHTAKYFQVSFEQSKWYDFWHEHLDWWGYVVNQPKRRKKYMEYYLQMLEKVEMQASVSDKPFQTWIHVSEDGHTDALFFHTQNPTDDFPYRDDDIAWDAKLPDWLQGMIDPEQYRYAKMTYEGLVQYVIQKKGLGIPIWSEVGPQEP